MASDDVEGGREIDELLTPRLLGLCGVLLLSVVLRLVVSLLTKTPRLLQRIEMMMIRLRAATTTTSMIMRGH